jgi:adenine-specific DNA-methyltransferase
LGQQREERALRYIGNKTRLLEFIGATLRERGISSGTAVDPFCGTASVAAELKRRGFRVMAADIMEYAYVFARAYVQTTAAPRFPALRTALALPGDTLESVIALLNDTPGAPAFIHDHYTPGGSRDRMYFTPENGARIDAIRGLLRSWVERGWIDDDGYHVLLASLLEAADRVANTTGVYAAWVKTWQPNATRPLELRTPPIVPGNGCTAQRADALDFLSNLEEFELLYLDPPYNTRQYAGYYHVPELIATGWFGNKPRTRGKTGLIADEEKRSDWSRSQRCEEVFEQLVSRSRWRHLVMSYNAEGIIPEATIARVLRECGRGSTYERRALVYKRYRSDADSEIRRYRGDSVREYLYCVAR